MCVVQSAGALTGVVNRASLFQSSDRSDPRNEDSERNEHTDRLHCEKLKIGDFSPVFFNHARPQNK